MNKRKNLLGILATSAVLAGCNYTPKTQTSEKYDNSVELYAPEETVRDKKRISKGNCVLYNYIGNNNVLDNQ